MSTPSPISTPRALHVFGGLHLGGAEIWTARAADALESAGWQVDFCLLNRSEGPLAERMRRRGRRVISCPAAPSATFPARFVGLLRGQRYEVVHSHVLLFGGVIAVLAAAAGVPARLVHLHNSRDGRADSPLRRAYRAAMRLAIKTCAVETLAVSDEARAFGGAAAAWLPCGIDLRPFAQPPDQALKTSLGLRPDAFVLGHAARLAPAKNQTLLLDAFALARSAEPTERPTSLHLVIAGDGPLRKTLQRRAERLGLKRRVHFLGARDDVPRLMTSVFDAFVMPSLHEGLPLAAVEAQAAGLPCLLSDRIGRQSHAEPRLVESLALESGPAAWAAALTRLRQRPRLEPAAGCAAVRRAGLDFESTARRLVEIYGDAREGAGRRAAPGPDFSMAG